MAMDAGTWLELWERVVTQKPRPRRRELLRRGAEPATAVEQLAVGAANASLLRFYSELFGAELPCRAECPRCGLALEFELRVETLLARGAGEARELPALCSGDWRVSFRPPREDDMDIALAVPDASAARDALFARCVTGCWYRGEANPLSSAPADVVERVNERMEECDPLALLEFDLCCPDCGSAWSSHLDVAAFLWANLDAWARRLLGEVDVIARVYGWDERTITTMSSTKRRLYVDMALK